MIDLKKLMKTKEYWLETIRGDLYGAISDYMATNKMSRSDLAGELGVTKGYISQVLNGNFNHRLDKLVELSLAVGLAPKLDFVDLNLTISNRINEFDNSNSYRSDSSYAINFEDFEEATSQLEVNRINSYSNEVISNTIGYA